MELTIFSSSFKIIIENNSNSTIQYLDIAKQAIKSASNRELCDFQTEAMIRLFTTLRTPNNPSTILLSRVVGNSALLAVRRAW